MLDWMKDIFSKKKEVKKSIEIVETEIASIKEKNRASLGLVHNWIDDQAFKNSFFDYGVPDFIRSDINKPIGEALTYTDLILYLAKRNISSVRYLEIGVSVGKNFFQILNSGEEGSFTGFDIEEINPVLESFLVQQNEFDWPTKLDSIKKNNSSLKSYRYKTLGVEYLSADVWDTNSWEKLRGKKYNIVFSDALHSPEAILFEFEMLVKNELLADNFIIIWDDLVGKMKRSFFRIIQKYNKVYNIEEVYLLNINGWIGQNEAPHSVGIISNFSFK